MINLEDLPPTFEEDKSQLEKQEDKNLNTSIKQEINESFKSESDKKIYINLTALDKITAKTSSIRLAVGEIKFFGSLEIKALKCLLKCKSPISITYDPNWLEIWSNRFSNPLSDAESFKLNNNSTISDIGRRAESLSEIQGQFMGLLKTSPEGWMEIQRIRSLTKSEDRDKIDMTGILQKIILADKIPIKAYPFRGYWGEVDSESDLNYYNKLNFKERL